MGIQFTPDQRRLFLVLTGMEPPKLDPDRLRGVADGFSEVLGLLASLPDDLVRTVGRVRSQFSGAAADAFEQSMSAFVSGPANYVGAAREAAGSVAKYARSAATNFEYAVYMAIGQIVQLMIEIIWCIVNAFRTFGLSLTLIPVYRAIASVFLRKLLRFLITHLTAHMVIELGVSLALDLLIQRVQIGRGTRDGIDGSLTREAAIGGALGGLFSAAGAAAVNRLIKGFRHNVSELTRLAVLDQLTTPTPKTTTGAGAGASESVMAKTFSDDIAALVTRHQEHLLPTGATKSGTGLSDAATTALTEDFGHLFAEHLAPRAGQQSARELGTAYGETFARTWGRADIAEALTTVLTRAGTPEIDSALRTVLTQLPDTVLDAARSQHHTLKGTLASLGLDSIASGLTEYIAGLFSGLATTGKIDATVFGFIAGTLNSAITNVSVTGSITLKNLTTHPEPTPADGHAKVPGLGQPPASLATPPALSDADELIAAPDSPGTTVTSGGNSPETAASPRATQEDRASDTSAAVRIQRSVEAGGTSAAPASPSTPLAHPGTGPASPPTSNASLRESPATVAPAGTLNPATSPPRTTPPTPTPTERTSTTASRAPAPADTPAAALSGARSRTDLAGSGRPSGPIPAMHRVAGTRTSTAGALPNAPVPAQADIGPNDASTPGRNEGRERRSIQDLRGAQLSGGDAPPFGTQYREPGDHSSVSTSGTLPTDASAHAASRPPTDAGTPHETSTAPTAPEAARNEFAVHAQGAETEKVHVGETGPESRHADMGLRPGTSPSDTSSHDSAVTSGKAGARPSVQQALAPSEQAGSAAPGNVVSSVGEVRTDLVVHTRQIPVDQSSNPRPVATRSFRSGQANGERVGGKPPLAPAESATGEGRLTSTADGYEEGLDAFILEAGEILQTEGVRTLFIPENDSAELARFERSHVRIKQVAQRRRSEGRDAARALAREIAESLPPDELRSDRGGLFAGSGRPRISGSRDRDGHSTTHPTSSHVSAGPASASRSSIARTWIETSSLRSNRFVLVDVAVRKWFRDPANDSRMNDVSAALSTWFRENRNPTELDERAARQLKDDLKLHTPNPAQADAQPQPPHREQRPGADPERTGHGHRGPLPTPTGHSGGPPTRQAPRQPTDIRRHAHATASFAGQIRLDSGPDTGWNWTDRVLRDVVTKLVIVRRGSRATLVDGPWPGGVQPLLVIAVGSHEGAWVRHPDGTKSWAAIEELTQVLRAAAEGQGLSRSIVLAWSGSGDQGLDLPRRVADITGRRVWAVAGELTVTRYGERDYLDLDTLSDWVPSDPSDREFSAPDRLEDPLADGPPQWWERVSTRTIVSKGRRLGRTFLGSQELTADSLNTQRNLSDSRTQVHLNPATLKIVGPAQPTPAADYVIETHGTPQAFLVHLNTGEHLAVPAKDFISKVILKRRSMQDLMSKNAMDVSRRRPRRVIRMHVCSVGAQSDVRQARTVILDSAASGRTGQLAAPPTPYTLDPLGALSPAQRMSNETGMDVVAGERSVGVLGERHSFAFFQVTDVDGTPGRIRHLRPEPTLSELTQLARTLGLASRETPTADDQDTALRLVRALKLVFGDGVATNPGHDHLRLLKGAASIELMRRQDTVLAAKTPYFTKDLLDRVVRTHHRTSPGQILDERAYQRTLDAAATDWHQNHRPLSGFVRLSQVRQVARAHEDDETRIRTVLGLHEHTPINRTHRSNEFWAQVATAELYASLDDVAGFEAHILHLDPHTHRRATDQRQSNQARQLVAWALAHGYNATNADVLAAANLVARGLTQPQTLLAVNPGGRDYAGLKLPRLEASQWLLSTTSAPGPWMHGGGPAPLLVTVQTTPPELRGTSRLRLTGHDGQQYVVTESEFAELLARDEIIYGAPLRVPLLLAMSMAATSNPGLPHTLAKRLGRTIWYTNAAVHWSTDHSSDSAMIARMGDRPWAHVTPDGESSPDFAQMPSIRNIGGTPTSATGSRSGLDGPKSPEPALGSPYAESILAAHSGNASPAPKLNSGPHLLLSRSQDEESRDASSNRIPDSLPADADAVSGPSADADNPLESSSPSPAREPIARAEKVPATKISGSPDQMVDEQPLGPTRLESSSKGEGASVDSFRQQMLRRINPDGIPRSDGGAPGMALDRTLYPKRGFSNDYVLPRQGERTSGSAAAPHGYGVAAEPGVALSPQYRGRPAAETESIIVTEEPAADPETAPLLEGLVGAEQSEVFADTLHTGSPADKSVIVGSESDVEVISQAQQTEPHRDIVAGHVGWDTLGSVDRHTLTARVAKLVPEVSGHTLREAYDALSSAFYSQPLHRIAGLMADQIRSGVYFPGKGGAPSMGDPQAAPLPQDLLVRLGMGNGWVSDREVRRAQAAVRNSSDYPLQREAVVIAVWRMTDKQLAYIHEPPATAIEAWQIVGHFAPHAWNSSQVRALPSEIFQFISLWRRVNSELAALHHYPASAAECDTMAAQIGTRDPGPIARLIMGARHTIPQAGPSRPRSSQPTSGRPADTSRSRLPHRSQRSQPRLPSRPAPRNSTDRAPVAAPQVLDIPASAWDLQRIQYAAEAAIFEQRLGGYLLSRKASLREMRKAASLALGCLQVSAPERIPQLGSENPRLAGAIGTDPRMLQEVTRRGNIREVFLLLWNSVRPLAGIVDPARRIAEISAERPLRVVGTPVPTWQQPDHAVPPLSSAERAFSVKHDPATGTKRLQWLRAEDHVSLKLQETLHQEGQDTGALVKTGTSGSAPLVLDMARNLAISADQDIDMHEVFLGALGVLLSTGSHSMHEIMRSAQLWDVAVGGGYGMQYLDEWSRYHRIGPLSEEELRVHVARNELFPDEIAGIAQPLASHATDQSPGSGIDALKALGIEPSRWEAHLDATAAPGTLAAPAGSRLHAWSRFWQENLRWKLALEQEELLRSVGRAPDGQARDTEAGIAWQRSTLAVQTTLKKRDRKAQKLRELGHDAHTLTNRFQVWATEHQGQALRMRQTETTDGQLAQLAQQRLHVSSQPGHRDPIPRDEASNAQPRGNARRGDLQRQPQAFPTVNQATLRQWQPAFDAARSKLRNLGGQEARLLSAAHLVARDHVAPPPLGSVVSPHESAYQKLYYDIVHMVTAQLHTEQDIPDAQIRAMALSRGLADIFGTRLPRSTHRRG